MASFKNMDTHFVSYNYFCFCFCVEFWKFIHGNDQRNCHARSSKKGKLNYYYYFSWKNVYLGIKFSVNTEFWSSLTRLGNIMKTIIITEVLHNKEKCGHSKEFERKAFFSWIFCKLWSFIVRCFYVVPLWAEGYKSVGQRWGVYSIAERFAIEYRKESENAFVLPTSLFDLMKKTGARPIRYETENHR